MAKLVFLFTAIYEAAKAKERKAEDTSDLNSTDIDAPRKAQPSISNFNEVFKTQKILNDSLSEHLPPRKKMKNSEKLPAFPIPPTSSGISGRKRPFSDGDDISQSNDEQLSINTNTSTTKDNLQSSSQPSTSINLVILSLSQYVLKLPIYCLHI